MSIGTGTIGSGTIANPVATSAGVAEPTFVGWAHDGAGRVVYAHDGAGATTYSHDGAGWAVWA